MFKPEMAHRHLHAQTHDICTSSETTNSSIGIPKTRYMYISPSILIAFTHKKCMHFSASLQTKHKADSH